MVKPLLLLAFVGLIFVFASCTRNCRNCRRISKLPPRSRHFPCSKNEKWAPCPEAVCAPKTCDDVGVPIPCIDLNPNGTCPSSPRCICKEGFVRNYRGICIPIEFCRPPIKCNKSNEFYDLCPSSCPSRTCGINDAAISCAPALPHGHPDCPPPTCRCRNGFYRNHLGNCVRWKNCPKCIERNRVFDPCIAPCPPRRCGVDKRLIKCAPPRKVGDPLCEAGCRCADGYVTNSEDVCIPEDECPLQCPFDEVSSNCIQGNCRPQTCSQLKFPAPCLRIDPMFCRKGCLCKEEYVRNNQGVCIPSCKCPPQCLKDEVYSNCTQSNCRPEKCTQVGFPIACSAIDPDYCKGGCLCKPGYARHNNGTCIPINECPSCGGDSNAEPTECGGNCNRHCSDIGKKPGACILICELNGCSCKKGLYYDDISKKCVESEQCPRPCPLDEIHSNCMNGGCQARNCSQYGKLVPCIKIDPNHCKKGCICKDKYLRARNGQCIPEEHCPGNCTGPNEHYSCGGACDNVCKTLDEQSQKNCPMINITCNNKCYCKEGYARAKNNTCIPISCCDSDNNS